MVHCPFAHVPFARTSARLPCGCCGTYFSRRSPLYSTGSFSSKAATPASASRRKYSAFLPALWIFLASRPGFVDTLWVLSSAYPDGLVRRAFQNQMSAWCGSGSRSLSSMSLPDMLHLKMKTSSRSGPSRYTCSLGSQIHVLWVSAGLSFAYVTRKKISVAVTTDFNVIGRCDE